MHWRECGLSAWRLASASYFSPFLWGDHFLVGLDSELSCYVNVVLILVNMDFNVRILVS